MRRNAVGVLGVIALIGAGTAWYLDEAVTAGVLARTGALLAALWIAWPSLRRLDLRTVGIGSLGLALILWRPRSAWLVLPVMALVLARTPRGRR